MSWFSDMRIGVTYRGEKSIAILRAKNANRIS
jgi:hypothetical protein